MTRAISKWLKRSEAVERATCSRHMRLITCGETDEQTKGSGKRKVSTTLGVDATMESLRDSHPNFRVFSLEFDDRSAIPRRHRDAPLWQAVSRNAPSRTPCAVVGCGLGLNSGGAVLA